MTTRQMGPKPQKQASVDFGALVDKEVNYATVGTDDLGATLEQAKMRLALRRQMFIEPQRAFLDDPCKRKGAICTRRAGKTYIVRHMLIEAVLNNPWADRNKAQPFVQYIAQTRVKAKDLVWAPIKQICQDIGLPAHWDEQEARVTFPNGVVLRLNGADKKDEIDKLLGDAYALAVVDESASFGPKMEELVLKALTMATVDYGGTIALVGTPGEAYAGLFYEIYRGKDGWKKHGWSYRENPSIPAQEKTDEWIVANVGPLHSPRVRRECFGEWVADASSLVYYFDHGRCAWDGQLPTGYDWRYIMGMDLGFRDPVAMVVGAYAPTHTDFFILDTFQKTEMLPSEIADKVRELKQQYPIQRIVVDTGGSMALSNMVEWNRRFAFGMIGAEKRQKPEFIRQMNSEMSQGKVRIRPDSPLVKEWQSLIWAPDDPESVRHDVKQKEHPGFPNHLADAALYVWRESLNFRSKAPKAESPRGSLDWHNEQELRAKQNSLQRAGKPGRFKYHQLFRGRL